VVVLTEWECYRALDLRRLAGVMGGRTLFDFRNLFETSDAEAAGLSLVAIGRAGASDVRPMPRSGRARASERVVASPS
jgi:UDPglucose 6-dehydrogenase